MIVGKCSMLPKYPHHTKRGVVTVEEGEHRMKAMVISEYGGPEVLHNALIEPETLTPTDVLVKIFATSVNPVDWKVRQGRLKERLPLKFPAILGWDAAGIIEDVGSSVTRWHIGDPVFVRPSTHRLGTYAEKVTVDQSLLAPKPPNLTYLEAASIPLAGLTAWEALVQIASLKPHQRVLIHGGAGGVGSYAIQLAKARGAFVAATASPYHLDYLRSLGADQPIDYHAHRLAQDLEPVDVVLDTIGGQTQQESYPLLKSGGHLVSIAQPPDQQEAQKYKVHGSWFFLEPDGKKLEALASLFVSGQMAPQVHQQFALKDIAQAHQLSEEGHVTGKIGIVVDGVQAHVR